MPTHHGLIVAAMTALCAAGAAQARPPNIADTSAWLTKVAEASVAAKACGYEINANLVLGQMLATYDSPESFTSEFFGNALDRAEAILKRDRDAFCRGAWAKFGPQGSDLKNLLLAGRG
jgi:hypothetical protein